MRRVVFLAVIAIILIGSGFLSIQLSQQRGTFPGVNVQTTNADASVLMTTPQKGALFVGYLAVLGGLLGGLATGLALLSWFLSRQVNIVKTLPNQGFSLVPGQAGANSLVGFLARYPALVIGVLIVLVVGAAVTLGVLGVLAPH